MAQKTRRKKTKESPPEAKGKMTFSTKAGTGTALHAEVADGRALWARRQAEVFNAIMSDLGGREDQSELTTQTVRRLLGLITLCEKAEIQLAEGKEPDVAAYVTAINAFNRSASAIGLNRRPKDLTPTLHEYLAAKAAERAAEADEAEAVEEGTADE